MSNARGKHAKRIPALLLAVLLTISMLPVSAYAGLPESQDRFTITVKDGDGASIEGAEVTYSVKADGETAAAAQKAEQPTDKKGETQIDLSKYEDQIADASVTITVTAQKEPEYEKKTLTDVAVKETSGSISLTLAAVKAEEPAAGQQDSEEPGKNAAETAAPAPTAPASAPKKTAADVPMPVDLAGEGAVNITVDSFSDGDWNQTQNTVKFKAENGTANISKLYWSTIGTYTMDTELSGDVDNAHLIDLRPEDNSYSFAVNSNGKYYIYAVDEATNVTVQEVDVDHIDKTEPVLSLSKDPKQDWHNDTVTITVTTSDKQTKEDATYQNQDGSGVKEVYYSTDSTAYGRDDGQTADGGDNTYTITVPKADFNGKYYVWAKDKAGNKSLMNQIEVKIRETAPDNATVNVTGKVAEDGWYLEEYPTIEITPPTEDDSGPKITTWYKLWNESLEQEESTTDPVEFNGTNNPQITGDGEYKLKVWTVDEAGNRCLNEQTVDINVNLAVPDILINEKSVVAEDTVAFDTFYQEAVTVVLDDNCDIIGCKSREYQKVRSYKDYDENGQWTPYPEGGITVNPNEKFIIFFKATDTAGNEKIVNSKGIVVDDQAPTGEVSAPDIDITPAAPNANGFYNSDVKVSLAALDPAYSGQDAAADGSYSGLKKITYRIYATDTDAEESGTLLDSSKTTGAVTDTDGLVKSWSGDITVKASKFNSNHVRVEVTAVDNAGNERVTKTADGKVQIDTTKPSVDVRYNNNSADSGTYFKANRTATITVHERNFNPEDVKVTITNTDGKAPQISGWTRTSAGNGNRDNAVWTATVTYKTDGDYTFGFTYTDLAGNRMSSIDYGNSVAPEKFTIDKTQPKITVSYNNNSASNGKYFKAARTATIVITEHNFDVNRVTFTRTAKLDGGNASLPGISWSNRGDVHTATIAYTADGDYTFDVTMTDRAGNQSGAASYGSSVAAKDFTIDKTITKPTITGVENGHAYADDVIPNISFSDVNYSSHEIRLTRTRKDEINEDVTQKFIQGMSVSGKGGSRAFDTFEKIEENDGIYTLFVRTTDMAGNEESQTVTFTVNRFGSVYEYGSYLISLIQDGGAYVGSVDEDLIVTEYNANRLVDESLNLEITLDGRPLEAKYVSDPVPNQDVKVGESGWYQYQYTISKENFASDGLYRLAISSKDEAKNTPESNPDNSTDESGTPVKDTMQFRVDSTAPEITSITGLEEPIINGQSADVHYTVYDAIGLKSITVYLNDEPAQTVTEFDDPNNFTGDFSIGERSYEQNVRIFVEDMAGNTTDTDDFGKKDQDGKEILPMPAYTFNPTVTVSTNFFVRWFANKPLFWGTIIAAAAVVAVIVLIITQRRRKKQGESK